MGKEELVASYLKGAISRRTFIRGLVAVGVSFGAAVTYSTALGPAAGAAPTGEGPFYPGARHDFYVGGGGGGDFYGVTGLADFERFHLNNVPRISLTPDTGAPGTTVVLGGSGFHPDSPLTVVFGNLYTDPKIDNFTSTWGGASNANGATDPQTTIRVPDLAPGSYTVGVRDAQGAGATTVFIVTG